MAYANGMPHGNLIERARDMSPKTLTAAEAAKHYGVSVSTIYRRARAGKLIATKVEGRWVITNTGKSVHIAARAAELRDSLRNRNALDAAPVHTATSYDPNEYAADMLARRRAALAARGVRSLIPLAA